MTIPINSTAPGGVPGGGVDEAGAICLPRLYTHPKLNEYLSFVPPSPPHWTYEQIASSRNRWTRTFLHMRRPDLAGIACMDYIRAREYGKGVCFTREYGD